MTTDAKLAPKGPRIRREQRTVAAMIRILLSRSTWRQPTLCTECQSLHDYAMTRLDRCPFQEDKTTCAKCSVHCYKPNRREEIRKVMRYAGPRMMWRHPILAIQHVVDGQRKVAVRRKA